MVQEDACQHAQVRRRVTNGSECHPFLHAGKYAGMTTAVMVWSNSRPFFVCWHVCRVLASAPAELCGVF